MIHSIVVWMTGWYARHPFLAGFIAAQSLPLAGALVNWIVYFPKQEGWVAFATKHPRLAWGVRAFRAIWPHLRKIQAFKPLADAVALAEVTEREIKKEEAIEAAAEKEAIAEKEAVAEKKVEETKS